MLGMFDNARPDPADVDRVKGLFVGAFGLPEDTLVSLCELQCHEPDCPPIETVVTARGADGSVKDWRVHKRVGDITDADVAGLRADGA